MKIGTFFSSIAVTCFSISGWLVALFFALIGLSIGVVLTVFPATYDLARFLAWKCSTKKMQRRWYRKSLRQHLASEMIRFRYGWYELYVSDDGIVHSEPRCQVPGGISGLHLAKPGNTHWRTYVRQRMRSFRYTFKESQVVYSVSLGIALANL